MAAHKKPPRQSVFSEDDAPQVAYSNNPITVSRDAEGLQLSPLGYIGTSAFNRESPDEPYRELPPRMRPRRKRKWPWILAIVVIICLGAGLGAGLGLGLHKKSHSTAVPETIGLQNDTTTSTSASAARTPSSTPITSVLSTTTSQTSSPASTSTSAPVTSGLYGVASFGCNTTAPTNVYITEVNPTSFTQECFVDYPTYDQGYNNPDVQVETINALTVYRFQDCMEQCAIYNQEHKGACHAVSYSAHLDPNVQKYGGNCWLKNIRGAPWTQADDDYTLMASAYLTEDWS